MSGCGPVKVNCLSGESQTPSTHTSSQIHAVHNPAQHSTEHHSTAQHSTAQRSTAHLGPAVPHDPVVIALLTRPPPHQQHRVVELRGLERAALLTVDALTGGLVVWGALVLLVVGELWG